MSKEKEIEEVLWTASHLTFLKKYSSRIALPPFSKGLVRRLKLLDHDGLLVSEVKVDEDTYALFMKEFNAVFRRSQYDAAKATMEAEWRDVEGHFFRAISSVQYLCVRKRYRCYVTFYGGGGSFGCGNQIYVRANPDMSWGACRTNYVIMHELIHLMVQPHASSRQVSQAVEERLVDSVIERPEIRRLLV